MSTWKKIMKAGHFCQSIEHLALWSESDNWGTKWLGLGYEMTWPWVLNDLGTKWLGYHNLGMKWLGSEVPGVCSDLGTKWPTSTENTWHQDIITSAILVIYMLQLTSGALRVSKFWSRERRLVFASPPCWAVNGSAFNIGLTTVTITAHLRYMS